MRARGGVILLLLLFSFSCDSETVIKGTTLLGNTNDRHGPYHVTTEVVDPDGVDEVWLHFRLGPLQHAVPMDEVRPAIFQGAIPGQPPYTEVRYFVKAIDKDQAVTDPPEADTDLASLYGFWVIGDVCENDLQCGAGAYCDASGTCRATVGLCAEDSDCGEGFQCGLTGSCHLTTRSCVLDETCLIGEVCDQLLGQCVPRPVCNGAQQCPPDFVCDNEVCLRACLSPLDCGPGESCGSGICSGAYPCSSTTTNDCPNGLACDPVLSICRPEGAGPCAPCQLDSHCGGPTDYCLLLSNGQYCGRDCSAATCPVGYLCNSSTNPPQCAPETNRCEAQ